MTKVRLKVSRVTQNESQGLGSIIDVPEDEALSMTDAGQAELVGPLPVVEPDVEPKTLSDDVLPSSDGGEEQAGYVSLPDVAEESETDSRKSWKKPR